MRLDRTTQEFERILRIIRRLGSIDRVRQTDERYTFQGRPTTGHGGFSLYTELESPELSCTLHKKRSQCRRVFAEKFGKMPNRRS